MVTVDPDVKSRQQASPARKPSSLPLRSYLILRAQVQDRDAARKHMILGTQYRRHSPPGNRQVKPEQGRGRLRWGH
jgi:hypothetical protein